ncbi:MAG: hypothetical protein HZB62_05150 [Nitrospirae bacterium]|nr:hypothetical protein [Nitrospirota bacterium]
MKKVIILLVLCMTGLVLMTGVSWSEEGAWYDAGENWIVRAYTASAGQDYSVTLEVLDTVNNLITDPIIGMATNPLLIAGNAGGPDVSLAFDEATATAYVLYTTPGGGAVSLQEMPDIVRAHGAMTVAPNPLLFGNVAKGKTLNKTVVVNNTGNIPVNITSIGTPGVPFSIVVAGTTCAVGTPVAVGGNCSIVVRFAPVALATYNDSFGINTSVGNMTVNLNGSGGYGLGAGF